MYKAVVIGFSAGGFKTLQSLLQQLPTSFSLPIVIVGHIPDNRMSNFAEILNASTSFSVHTASDKMIIEKNNVYIAPAGYHLLFESENTLSLSVDDPVCFVRPSIDVLFESAAEATDGKLISIVLSGANNDGVNGINYVKQLGGVTIVQNPHGAEFTTLPNSTIDEVDVDYVCHLDDIIAILISMEH